MERTVLYLCIFVRYPLSSWFRFPQGSPEKSILSGKIVHPGGPLQNCPIMEPVRDRSTAGSRAQCIYMWSPGRNVLSNDEFGKKDDDGCIIIPSMSWFFLTDRKQYFFSIFYFLFVYFLFLFIIYLFLFIIYLFFIYYLFIFYLFFIFSKVCHSDRIVIKCPIFDHFVIKYPFTPTKG
ncbi:hypothetical protein VUR80DRAFT_410 [Thermomyces stellatus]